MQEIYVSQVEFYCYASDEFGWRRLSLSAQNSSFPSRAHHVSDEHQRCVDFFKSLFKDMYNYPEEFPRHTRIWLRLGVCAFREMPYLADVTTGKYG